jgi:FkbM family methyltransferase
MMKTALRLMHRTLQTCGYDVACCDGYVMVHRQAKYFPQDRAFNRFLLEHHLAFLMKRYGVDCVLDVGANVGDFAMRLRQWGFRGEIMSFEPVRAAYDVLQDVASGDRNWHVYPVALGSRSGSASLHVTQRSDFSSFLKPNAYVREHFGTLAHLQRIEDVPIRRLDELLDGLQLRRRSSRLFLKMDTQGYDLEVWAGLGAYVDSLVGLQSEVAAIPLYERMPTMREAISTYEAEGFLLSGLFPVTREAPTARVIEFDCVMVREPGPTAARACRCYGDEQRSTDDEGQIATAVPVHRIRDLSREGLDVDGRDPGSIIGLTEPAGAVAVARAAT